MMRCSVIDGKGNLVWTDDPELDSVARLGPGWYRVRFRTDISNDAVFSQPLAGHTDVPRSLLAWMALDGPNDIHVRVEAHFVNGGTGSPHDHRDDLDMRFSLARCRRLGDD